MVPKPDGQRWLAAVIAGAFFVGAALVRVSPTWGLPAVMLGATALLLVFGKAWWRQAPLATTPGYRIIVVTTLLFSLLIAVNVAGPGSPPLPPIRAGHGIPRLAYFALLILLAVPTMLAGELFLRGFLYTLFERWRGAGAAVIGTTVVSALLIAPLTPFHADLVLGSVAAPLLLAGSRWLTRSLVPALVVEGVMGVFLAAFLGMMAVS